MKTKSFAFVLLRVLSIWILVNYVIINFFTSFVGIYIISFDTNSRLEFLSYSFLMPLFLLIIWSITSWFLWFKADGLSNKFVISDVKDDNLEAINQEKILSVAFTILGLYFVLDSLSELIGNLVYAYNYSALETQIGKYKYLPSIIKPIFTLFIGLFCIMKIETIKYLVKKLQNLGIQKAS